MWQNGLRSRRMKGIAILVGFGVMILGVWLLKDGKQDHPGTPADRMAQTPMAPSPEPGSAQAYAMVGPTKRQLIGVTTAVVEQRPLDMEVRAVGRVDYDERRIAHVNLRISGWVEDLFVDYTGELVRKGQPLFTLYSPDLVTSQDEYLLAVKTRAKLKDSPLSDVRQDADRMVEAAHDRLRLWTLTEKQIEEVTQRSKAQTYVTLHSPISGYVIDKTVFKGMFVTPDMRLYTIADLSTVWVETEIYEYEVPFVKVEQPATVTVASYPGAQFHGRVPYIYPYLNKEARTVRVRVELPNPQLRLKPGMYGNVTLRTDSGQTLVVPKEAVLDTGLRQLVFLDRGQGVYEPHPVKLGRRSQDWMEVLEGIKEGDRVVTSANFLLDAESKLASASSMQGMMGRIGMADWQMRGAHEGKMEGMKGMEGMRGMGMEGMPGMKTEPAKPVSETRQAAGFSLTFGTVPEIPKAGETLLRLKVNDPAGYAVTNAQVEVSYTMPMPGMTESKAKATHIKDGIYEAKAMLGMGGTWVVTTTVTIPGLPPITEKFEFTVTGGGM